jgi:hypothetical protein
VRPILGTLAVTFALVLIAAAVFVFFGFYDVSATAPHWRITLWVMDTQVGGVEAFGEPAVHRREKVAGFGAATLVAAEPGETHDGAQFPELGTLLLGDAQGFAIQFLGGFGGSTSGIGAAISSPARAMLVLQPALASSP